MQRKWLNSVSVAVGDDGLLNSGPLATEAKQDNLLAAVAPAAGVAIGTKTTGVGWDNGGNLDLGAGHSYRIVRISAVEDTYIVIDNINGVDPVTTGEFIPAGSAMAFPCVGVRYIHHKQVSVAGTIGASAFAAAS